MRIVLATSSFLQYGGGIASYNHELVRIFLEKGHEVFVVTADQIAVVDFPADKHLTVKNFPLTPNYSEYEVISKQIFNAIFEFDPDTIISSDHILVASLFPAFADRRVKITVSHFFDGVLARAAAVSPKYTDWIVSLSEVGKEWLILNTGASKDQVVVVYNTVGLLKRPLKELIELKADARILRLVFPGGALFVKGVDHVFSLLSALKEQQFDWKLTWLGPNKLPGGLSLKNFISRKIVSNVEFLGKVPRAQAEAAIDNAHCILLPSRGEGCPMTLLEALRSATIPLGSNCPSGMREIISASGCGYVVPLSDPRKYSDYLKLIANDTSLRDALHRTAYRYYQEHLDPATWYKKMISIVQHKRASRKRSSTKDVYDAQYLKCWHRHKHSILRPTDYFKSRIKIAYETSIIIKSGINCRRGRTVA